MSWYNAVVLSFSSDEFEFDDDEQEKGSGFISDSFETKPDSVLHFFRSSTMPVSLEALGIDQMTVEERLELVGVIWDSIAHSADRPPISEALRAELDRRLADHLANPADVVPWEDVKSVSLCRLPPSRAGSVGGGRGDLYIPRSCDLAGASVTPAPIYDKKRSYFHDPTTAIR